MHVDKHLSVVSEEPHGCSRNQLHQNFLECGWRLRTMDLCSDAGFDLIAFLPSFMLSLILYA